MMLYAHRFRKEVIYISFFELIGIAAFIVQLTQLIVDIRALMNSNNRPNRSK